MKAKLWMMKVIVFWVVCFKHLTWYCVFWLKKKNKQNDTKLTWHIRKWLVGLQISLQTGCVITAKRAVWGHAEQEKMSLLYIHVGVVQEPLNTVGSCDVQPWNQMLKTGKFWKELRMSEGLRNMPHFETDVSGECCRQPQSLSTCTVRRVWWWTEW